MSLDATTRKVLPSSEVTILHLFRHGKVDTGGRRRAYGHTDMPLTEQGRKQGENLVRLAGELPHSMGVFSSDLSRCLKVAQPISQSLTSPLVVSDELREQHMGLWENRTWEELTVADEDIVQSYWADYVNTVPPEGESFKDMAQRIVHWWESNKERLWGKRWIWVGHIGPIRALLCHLLNYPLSEALRFAPAPGSHTELLIAESGTVLKQMGAVPSVEFQPPLSPSKIDRPLRVAMSGSAGVGKTTLAKQLAQDLNLPYIPEGIRARVRKGLKIADLSYPELQNLILELWEEQISEEKKALNIAGGFVSDRSSMDYAAFWLHYGFTGPQTASFLAACIAHVPLYDRIVLLPWGVIPLEQDGVRSANEYVQLRYQALLEGLLYQNLSENRLLRMGNLSDFEMRRTWLLKSLRLAFESKIS